MTTSTLRPAALWLSSALVACALDLTGAMTHPVWPAVQGEVSRNEEAVQIHYLEIVTPEVDATCAALEKIHDVVFSEPHAELGNARTAPLKGGGMMGVRAPMRADEEPVVRPYVLVDDIESVLEAAVAAGGELALPPMEIAGRGKCAIYIQGGIQHGPLANLSTSVRTLGK